MQTTVSSQTKDKVPDQRLISLRFWWILPASVVFSIIAIAAGISGALFFSPFFMLAVGLSPILAVSAGLITQLFGMVIGLASYVRQRLVDYQIVKVQLSGAIPGVIGGAILAHSVSSQFLHLLFGSGLLVLALFIYRSQKIKTAHIPDFEGAEKDMAEHPGEYTRVVTRDGTQFCYRKCPWKPGAVLAITGGFLTGLISAGLPEISTTQLVTRCKIPAQIAVATSIFVLAIATAVGVGIYGATLEIPWEVLQWSVPGVILGSLLGSRVGKYISDDMMKKSLTVLFILIGLTVLFVDFLGL